MKVTFKYGIGSFSGTVDNATYWATARKTGSVMRKWVLPTATTQNESLGKIAANIKTIWSDVTAEYKADMKNYCRRDFNENSNPEDPFASRVSNYAMFVKLLYAFQKANSASVNLETITISDIRSLFTDEMSSVFASIQAGYLRSVSDSSDFNESI